MGPEGSSEKALSIFAQCLFWGTSGKVSLGIIVEKNGIHIWKAHEK